MANTKKTNNESPAGLAILISIVAAIILEASNFDFLAQVGFYIKYAQFGLFGLMAYVFPVAGALFVIYLNVRKHKGAKKPVCFIVIFICLCALMHLLNNMPVDSSSILDSWTVSAGQSKGGGIIGGVIAIGLSLAVSKTGAYIILIIAIIICLLIATQFPVAETIRRISSRHKNDEDLLEEEDDRQYRYKSEPVRKSDVTRRKKPSEPVMRSDADLKERNIRVYNIYDTDGNFVDTIYKDAPKPSGSKSQKSEPVKRADLTRTRNKSKGMREEQHIPELKRSRNKTYGLGESLEVNPLSSNNDELQEITHKANKNTQVRAKDLKPEKKIVVTDIDEPETIFADELAAAPEVAAGKTVNSSKKKSSGSSAEKKAESAESYDRASASVNSGAKRTTDVKAQAVPSGIKKPAGIRPGSTSSDGYKFPPLDLLDKRKGRSGGGENLQEVSDQLEEILAQFGVEAKVVNAQSGPSVTRYEIQPKVGTRVNKITSLADDLKLNLAVPDIRIEAPIPGRAAVGIEIPNKNKSIVLMRDLLEDPTLLSHPSKIAYAAGKDISGNVVVSDIAKMPHMLIAGTTGSGKSVFVNTILMTILFRAKPSEVGLIIIDPKQVEFGIYRGIPHLVQDVVTDPAQAVSTLRWAVAEMASRYNRMALSGVKDFQSYNKKFEHKQLNPEEENPKRMGQIVIVIDELADLMMVASKEVEGLICRLAQLARAAGIHLLIATQRPSVDVVTGLIKANIPARVALLVASGTDSRTIIDMNGAEKLLGYGDMLFYPTGYVKPVRVQGAFVSEKEVSDTIEFIKANNESGYYEEEAKAIEQYKDGSGSQMAFGASQSSDDNGGSGYDEHFYEAGMLCIETGKASSSMLQRRFNIGFNRAARIIDQLEEAGAVGPQNGAKPREILVDAMTFEEIYQNL